MSDQWFYGDGARAHGPFTMEQLIELAAMGELQPTTLVWKGGRDSPRPASAVSELASLPFSDPLAPETNPGRLQEMLDSSRELVRSVRWTVLLLGGFGGLVLIFGSLALFRLPGADANRGVVWMIICMMAGMILGSLIWGLLVLRNITKELEPRNCPFCGERVEKEASMCMSCQKEFPADVPGKV